MMQHCSALQTFEIADCEWFCNDCICALRSCTQLRSLRCVVELCVSSDAIADTIRCLLNLETFDLGGTALINDRQFVCAALGEHCPRLKSVVLYAAVLDQSELDIMTARCTNLTDLELHALTGAFTLNCTHLPLLRRLKLV